MDYLHTTIQTIRTKMMLSMFVIMTAMLASAPMPANAMGVFGAFPGLMQLFKGEEFVNSLPVYEVKTRQLSEQETLLRVCEARGYGEDCAKTLLGMMWKESLNDNDAIGDQGRARGYFQIWYQLHSVELECVEDLECSAHWTLDYMESNGYPYAVHHAVQCHNGCLIENGYAASAMRHGWRLWDAPLPMKNGVRLAIN